MYAFIKSGDSVLFQTKPELIGFSPERLAAVMEGDAASSKMEELGIALRLGMNALVVKPAQGRC